MRNVAYGAFVIAVLLAQRLCTLRLIKKPSNSMHLVASSLIESLSEEVLYS